MDAFRKDGINTAIFSNQYLVEVLAEIFYSSEILKKSFFLDVGWNNDLVQAINLTRGDSVCKKDSGEIVIPTGFLNDDRFEYVFTHYDISKMSIFTIFDIRNDYLAVGNVIPGIGIFDIYAFIKNQM